MPLPTGTTLDDIGFLCTFLGKKPKGVTLAQARTGLDAKHLQPQKIAACKFFGLVEESAGGVLKLTDDGRTIIESLAKRTQILSKILNRVAPYKAIVESVNRNPISVVDVATQWRGRFDGDVSGSDKGREDQAMCLFEIAVGAGVGSLKGRGASATFEFQSTHAMAVGMVSNDLGPDNVQK